MTSLTMGIRLHIRKKKYRRLHDAFLQLDAKQISHTGPLKIRSKTKVGISVMDF